VVRAVTLPFREFAEVARRPGARSVLVVDGAQYLLVGSFDIILVVLAGEYLDLGGSGAGVLGSLFGVGSLLSNAVTGRLAGRARLAPTMLVMVAVVAAGCAVFGASVSLVAACVVLPIAGFGRSLTSLLGRVLMQRSAPPSALPVLFGALETTSGLGLLLGSLMTQLLIAASGVEAALFAVSGTFVVVLALTARSLRRADEGADVPVVAMSLLRRLPVFEPLPTAALEAVARGAEECHLEPGDIVIRQGEPGDRYFAIAAGRFDVTVDDVVRRTLGRGDGFGEIALLADTPRTATVTAASAGTLLAVERVPFLVAVTGHDASRTAAWSAVRTHHVVDDESDQADPGDQPSGGNPRH
jgi:MFS family permease